MTERLQTLSGYGLLWSDVADRQGYRIQFLPGAFADSIRAGDVQGLLHHSANYPISRQRNGSMTLQEDSRGLRVTYRPNGSQAGRDAVAMVQAVDVRGLSIGFAPVDFELIPPDKSKGEKTPLMLVSKADLKEVSIVTWPAMRGSSIAAELTVRQLHEQDKRKSKPQASPEVLELRRILEGHKEVKPQPAKTARQELDALLADIKRQEQERAEADEPFQWLRHEWDIINYAYFGGSLKSVPEFAIVDCRNHAGSGRDAWGWCTCSDSPRIIGIHEPFMEDKIRRGTARNVLLHEAIHQRLLETIGNHDHDYRFALECNRIGRKLGLPDVSESQCYRWPFTVDPMMENAGRKLCEQYGKSFAAAACVAR